jgi:pimeloyl-ACP methyl ester carboxylesterase
MAAIEGQDISGGTGAITAGLAFDSAGEGSPHLLFLHGWCGDRSFFAPQFDHFSAAHRVVSVDLPGHGKSRAPTANTIEALAADVAALGRDLGLGRGAMVGHSLGAMVGLALAQQAPDLVSAVIMVDPPPLSQEVWRGFAGELLPGFQGPIQRRPGGSSWSRCSCRLTTLSAVPRSLRACVPCPMTSR